MTAATVVKVTLAQHEALKQIWLDFRGRASVDRLLYVSVPTLRVLLRKDLIARHHLGSGYVEVELTPIGRAYIETHQKWVKQ